MKRCGLILATLVTVVLTGFVLARAGWFAAAGPLRFVPRHGHAKTHDPLFSDAGLRWRRGQATHWRACLLQR
jgi:hypothetical protein